MNPSSLRLIMLLAAIGIALTVAQPASAYGEGGGGDSGSYGGSGGLSRSTTRAVTRTIKRDIKTCRKLDKVYRYDCYRQVYILASQHMNGQPAYADAQKALDGVVVALDRIVRRNADPQTAPKRRNLQSFTPIKPAALPKAKRDFGKALDEAETLLLRSAAKDNSHFARIAEAVHSNKVLLRSLLQLPAGTRTGLPRPA